MEEEEETPHWKNTKISSKLLSKFVGKNCHISFKKSFYFLPYEQFRYHTNAIINEYDNTYIYATINNTIKVKKETITKKYSYLFEIDNIYAIGMEDE